MKKIYACNQNYTMDTQTKPKKKILETAKRKIVSSLNISACTLLRECTRSNR